MRKQKISKTVHGFDTLLIIIMAELNFYLRDLGAEKTTIYCSVSYDGFRMRFSTKLRVPLKFWNKSKQRVREVIEFSEGKIINSNLNKIQESVFGLYERLSKNGIILTPKEFKKELLSFEKTPLNEKRINSFWDQFDQFIEEKKRVVLDVRDYHNSLRKHLLAIESKLERPLTFMLISAREDNFASQWEEYLKYEAINAKGEKGLGMNTVGKQNKNLKVFLNWTFENGIIPRFSLKQFPTLAEEVDNIYLTEEELSSLEHLGLEGTEKVVRDLFLIGCETGLRFSDLTRLSSQHISDGLLTFSPKKTSGFKQNKIIIPLSNRFKSILEDNLGAVPVLSNVSVTYFNKTIRRVCKKAGISKKSTLHRLIGGEMQKEVRYRYQKVSSHTCRRTFCTLKFLKGMPAQAIMKFSGHKTERNFLKYLKLDAELTAKKYGEYF